ncbi:MAG TPA: hypothetical protein VEP66_14055, partial [Myxococcales bacterium]|nr:hypothetical protein [Myxococcales bacterium]
TATATWPWTTARHVRCGCYMNPHAQPYAIARGSAMECAAVLDALFVVKAVDATTKQRGDDLLERIVGMLTRLCR